MVAEFGFKIALMESGLLMREQFFRPRKFHPALALRHQLILGGQPPVSPEERFWRRPFSFMSSESTDSTQAKRVRSERIENPRRLSTGTLEH
jgi:hypothetical protein